MNHSVFMYVCVARYQVNHFVFCFGVFKSKPIFEISLKFFLKLTELKLGHSF